MYLAPLNYDRYFKKIFSEPRFAKRFLEDFFDVIIESIEILATEHRVTDDASVVEFDFRCKIDGNFIIVDMQQWFKSDVVHRFYTYHCASTVLQLEKLPLKSIALEAEKERKVKDYSEILPVITLVWLVDDTFGFKDDYASYCMTPEILTDFIKNKLWQQPDVSELLEEREKVLTFMENKTRNLDFLQKNKLIYVFQKNVIKNAPNEKTARRYVAWFELAEKTKNRKNEKSDFAKFENDALFSDLMRRICKEILTEEDFTYIDSYQKYAERVKRYDDGVFKEGEKLGIEKGEKLGFEKGKIEIALNMLRLGLDIAIISTATGLSIAEINQLKKQ
jgi:predicted transposase/invertase (TIGR01784 family)